jgi:hypothetical protein
MGAVLALSGLWGCELIASVDRNQIPATGSGGAASSSTGTGGTGATGATGGTGGTSTSSTGGTGGTTSTSSTGGAGGTGGTTSSTGGTDGGTDGGTCTTASDCPGSDTDCAQRTCVNGACGVAFTPAMTATSAQTPGDCKKNVCDGDGNVVSTNDDTDVPVDGNACTGDVCTAGVPSNPTLAAGTACAQGGGSVCDGNGNCVGCVDASTCPGVDDECQTRTCTNGTCGFSYTASGTAVSSQTPGDCKKNVCDGAGNVVSQDDDGDVPDDSNPCTNDLCNAGVPSHTPVASGTSCGASLVCNGAGTCVGCNTGTDCPGQDTECHTRTCNAGNCGVSFTASGTPVSSQTPGDCKKNVCDGAGNVVSVADNTDVPADDGNQCTGEVCNAGVPAHPPKPLDTPCSQGGGSFCNATGSCVACNTASECPGSDTDCHTRTCTAGSCGVSNTPAGTPTSAQTPGDCQKNVCDGSGNVVSVADNTDVPADDGNQCTGEVCNAGVPAHPARPLDTPCSQGGGSFCNATGTCVQCNTASECPGSDTDCHTRTCSGAGACGVSNTPAGTPTSAQTPGDCQKNVCDGAGNVTSVEDDTDVPADDGNQCTGEVCNAGVPAHPAKPLDTPCSQGGGSFCNGTGSCVQCNTPSECPGSDTECQQRTCSAGACGVNDTAAGTPTSAQTPGDCQKNVCDGAGNVTSVEDDTDVPADDGNPCTGEVCNAGVPAHPAQPAGTPCSQGGGTVCDGAGSCVQCNTASDCPGVDTECQQRTCSAGACGVNDTAAGTPTSAQTPGDCHTNECDGAGNVVSVVDDTDVPVDGNQCTDDVCTAGVPTNPPTSAGTTCSQDGGTTCDGAGNCILVPEVASTSPADATTPTAAPSISVTFTTAMGPATLTGQTSAGACSGSIQVSLDGFATCIAFSSASASMSNANATATFTAAPGLLVNRTYKIRVTTAAASAVGVALPATFTQTTGFTTTSPNLCDTSVVISQVYGGGGNASATYKNDFVELHNRGTTTVSLAGWSVQYASAGGSFNSATNLSGSIPPGGYFLVQEASGGANGVALPAADASGSINLAAGAGKVALVSSTTLLGASCSGGTVVDMVGYGGTASCFEGSSFATGPANNTTSIFRGSAGCTDVNNNGADFAVAAVSPRNSATAASTCACTVENESGAALEAQYCDTQFPLSITAQAGTAQTVFGRVFESGVTGMGSANASVRAQLGYGPATANPEYEAGWTWTNGTYNASCSGCGNNDEYQATFNLPAAGSYVYVYRFSLDSGVSWTYCDNDQGDFGAGSNPSLTFDLANEAALTSTP